MRGFVHHLRKPLTNRAYCDSRCTGEVNIAPAELKDICWKCLRLFARANGIQARRSKRW